MILPKLFAFDVDGTLFNSQNRILDSTKEALQLLETQGHKIILASGRGPLSLEPVWEQLGRELPYIGFNGALVVDGSTVVFERTLPAAGAEQAVQLAREYGLGINAYEGRRWVIEEENPYSAEEGRLVNAQPELGDFGSLKKIHKLLMIGPAEAVRLYRDELRARSDQLNVALSLPNYCEVVNREVSKGRILQKVCGYFGVELEDTVAFGDGENDLELLATAGLAVAMGNGHRALLAEADYVTASNDDDGILQGVRWALNLAC